MFCINCGLKLPDSSKLCSGCGFILDLNNSTHEPPKVDPKYKKEIIGNSIKYRKGSEPPKVDPKYKMEFVGEQQKVNKSNEYNENDIFHSHENSIHDSSYSFQNGKTSKIKDIFNPATFILFVPLTIFLIFFGTFIYNIINEGIVSGKIKNFGNIILEKIVVLKNVTWDAFSKYEASQQERIDRDQRDLDKFRRLAGDENADPYIKIERPKNNFAPRINESTGVDQVISNPNSSNRMLWNGLRAGMTEEQALTRTREIADDDSFQFFRANVADHALGFIMIGGFTAISELQYKFSQGATRISVYFRSSVYGSNRSPDYSYNFGENPIELFFYKGKLIAVKVFWRTSNETRNQMLRQQFNTPKYNSPRGDTPAWEVSGLYVATEKIGIMASEFPVIFVGINGFKNAVRDDTLIKQQSSGIEF